MTKIRGQKPYTIEDWKNKADSNRKKAEYWEKKEIESEKEIAALTLAYKTDVQTLQNCNADLRGSKDELFKLYEERAALLDGLSSKVSEKSKTIESLLSQNQTNEQVLNKVKGDCMILESHNTDLINSIISTKVLATVGWIFVLILLVAFILK
jgi:ATP-dependent Lon protease